VVNSDPYGAGWMVRIEISDAAETNALLSAADYKKLVGA
jgi:glycine cleavage system H protein